MTQNQLLQVVFTVSLAEEQLQPANTGVALSQNSSGEHVGIWHELTAAAPLQHESLVVKISPQALLLLLPLRRAGAESQGMIKYEEQ